MFYSLNVCSVGLTCSSFRTSSRTKQLRFSQFLLQKMSEQTSAPEDKGAKRAQIRITFTTWKCSIAARAGYNTDISKFHINVLGVAQFWKIPMKTAWESIHRSFKQKALFISFSFLVAVPSLFLVGPIFAWRLYPRHTVFQCIKSCHTVADQLSKILSQILSFTMKKIYNYRLMCRLAFLQFFVFTVFILSV